METTPKAYATLAKQKGFTPHTIKHTKTNCQSHYIGSPNAKVVLLFFHGGGYVMPASPAHLEWLYNLVTDVNKAEGSADSFAVLVLSYSLVPDAVYPAQLAQATECLNDLLTKQGRKPDNILLGGDSAGGNLCLSLLSHILHPHPSSTVSPVVDLQSPLKGALLISPWVEFDGSKRESWRTKLQSDVSSPPALKLWGPMFLNEAKSDNYSEAVHAGEEWWEELDKAVSNVLVWGGGGEVLIDGIKVVMQDLEKAYPTGVESIIGHNMCHEQMVVDTTLGYAKGESAELVENWVKAKL